MPTDLITQLPVDPKTGAIQKKSMMVLQSGLVAADEFLNKKYLGRLRTATALPLSQRYNDKEFCIALEKIDKFVFDKNENVNEKLITVLASIRDSNSSIFFVVDSDGTKTDFYIGTRNDNPNLVGLSCTIIEKSFLGNFPGSEIKKVPADQTSNIIKSLETKKVNNTVVVNSVACVTVLPSLRNDDDEKFVQGLEKFVDAMQGNAYKAVFVAKPLNKNDIESLKRGYEEMYAAISPHSKTTLSYGVNTSNAVSVGTSISFSDTISNSISNTTGASTSQTDGVSDGTSNGSNTTLFPGFSTNCGSNHSTNHSFTSGQNWSNSVTSGTSTSKSTSDSENRTKTEGDTRSVSVEHHNKTVEEMLSKIDEQLENLKEWEAFGIYDCAAYFISPQNSVCLVAANAYRALVSGSDTFNEGSYLSLWTPAELTGTSKMLDLKNVVTTISHFAHPVFKLHSDSNNPNLERFVTPGNFVCGKDLPIFMGLPRKSVNGLTVTSMAEFGRNVFKSHSSSNAQEIRLGCVKHMGKNQTTSVMLDLKSFTSHCFVTGSTGSGKSNTTYKLVSEISNQNIEGTNEKIKYLIIEPAKGEYRKVFGDANVYTSNPLIGRLLKLNPFRFPEKIHILEHLDRLIEIFGACWDMEAAMPAFLKSAMERCYINKGWDLLRSVYLNGDNPRYPTFEDLKEALEQVIAESSYSNEVQSNYKGSLVTRVASLANGIVGEIFNSNADIDDETLFDKNSIVDLSRIGSSETKSLLMGILVLKLNEYRMATAVGTNSSLRHITVMEEAHNLLRNNSGSGNKLAQKSTEMITNSIAEMRTYGEGFIIVDQSPTAVDIAAIKNTNTKIIMRLPERNDCEAMANASGLNEDQMMELTKLPMGAAVVMQNNWIESVLCQIDYYKTPSITPDETTIDALMEFRKDIASFFLKQDMVILNGINIAGLPEFFANYPINRSKKAEYEDLTKRMLKDYKSARMKRKERVLAEFILEVCQVKGLFNSLECEFKYDKDGKLLVNTWFSKFKKLSPLYFNADKNTTAVQFLSMLCPALKSDKVDYKEVYKKVRALK